MKTPAEIKKGLEAGVPIHYHIGDEPRLNPLQYLELVSLHGDALAYIKHLETRYDEVFRLCGDLHHDMLEQRERGDRLEAERDAAVADMTSMAEYVSDTVCEWCDQTECESGCMGTGSNRGFKWRGVQEGE